MRHSLRECDDQSSMVSGMRGIFGVQLSQNVRTSTTRSFDFLGLSFNSPPSRLLHKARLGEDVIVGVIDTGIIFPIRGSPDLFLGCSSYFSVPPTLPPPPPPLIFTSNLFPLSRNMARVQELRRRRIRPGSRKVEGYLPNGPAVQYLPLQP